MRPTASAFGPIRAALQVGNRIARRSFRRRRDPAALSLVESMGLRRRPVVDIKALLSPRLLLTVAATVATITFFS